MLQSPGLLNKRPTLTCNVLPLTNCQMCICGVVQHLVTDLQGSVQGGSLSASGYLLLSETMYQLGTCNGAASSDCSLQNSTNSNGSSSDTGDWTEEEEEEEEDAAASDEDPDTDDHVAAAAAAAAAAWVAWDQARRCQDAGSSRGSGGGKSAVVPETHCKRIQQQALRALPAEKANAVQKILKARQREVRAHAELAAKIIRDRNQQPDGLPATPNVLMGSLAQVAELSHPRHHQCGGAAAGQGAAIRQHSYAHPDHWH